MSEVSLTVNGRKVSGNVEDRTLLVHFLRENLGLTGTHVGCDTSQCGACVVHVDGKAVKSCTMLAAQASGSTVTTIEGLANGADLHPVQAAFKEHHGLQCGFCTPGMIMTATDMIRRHPEGLDEATVRAELEGNICRCTGYHNIVKAILAASKTMSKGKARRESGLSERQIREWRVAKYVRSRSVDRPLDRTIRHSTTHYSLRVREENSDGNGRHWRTRCAQGRQEIHHRRRPLCRRHGGARHEARRVRAQPARACRDQEDRRQGAKAMPGVIGVLTGKEIKADGIGNLICGWMIHSKDGTPMKMGAWSPLAVDRVRYVGDAVVIVVADTKGQARDAAEAVEITYKELKAVVDAAEALKKGAPQLHPEADSNLIFDWEIGDAKATDAAIAGGRARHHDAHRQQPAGAQRHGAARGARPLRQGRGSLHLLDDLAEPACRAAGDERLLQCRAGKQAARHRARCRRRLRLEDLHLSGRDRLPVGVEEDRRAGQMGGRPHRKLPDRRAWPRPSHHGRDGASTRTTRSSG